MGNELALWDVRHNSGPFAVMSCGALTGVRFVPVTEPQEDGSAPEALLAAHRDGSLQCLELSSFRKLWSSPVHATRAELVTVGKSRPEDDSFFSMLDRRNRNNSVVYGATADGEILVWSSGSRACGEPLRLTKTVRCFSTSLPVVSEDSGAVPPKEHCFVWGPDVARQRRTTSASAGTISKIGNLPELQSLVSVEERLKADAEAFAARYSGKNAGHSLDFRCPQTGTNAN